MMSWLVKTSHTSVKGLAGEFWKQQEVQGPTAPGQARTAQNTNINPATGKTQPLNTIDRTTNVNSLPLLGLVPRLGLDVFH